MTKSLALALLVTLASAPVVGTLCEFLCLPGDMTSRDHDCDSARHPSTGTTIQNARASCSHASSTPWIAALKRTAEAERPVAALDVTFHPPAENVSSALARPVLVPISFAAAALQIPLRI